MLGLPVVSASASHGNAAHQDPAPEVTVNIKNAFLGNVISSGSYKMNGLAVCVLGVLIGSSCVCVGGTDMAKLCVCWGY